MRESELTKLIGYTRKSIGVVEKKLSEADNSESEVMRLKRIKAHLIKIENEANTDAISGTLGGMSRLVLDSWSFNSELGELLLNVDSLYKNLT